MRLATTSGSGVPGTPTIGTATAGNTTASVVFTVPTYTGKGGAVTYRVLSTPGSITATGSSSPITVTGLSNGTAYTFQVRTETSYGVNSSYSSASNSVTPVAPPAPTPPAPTPPAPTPPAPTPPAPTPPAPTPPAPTPPAPTPPAPTPPAPCVPAPGSCSCSGGACNCQGVVTCGCRTMICRDNCGASCGIDGLCDGPACFTAATVVEYMKKTIDEGKKMQDNQTERTYFAIILDGEVVSWFSFFNTEESEQNIAIYSSNPTIVPLDTEPVLGSKWDGNKIVNSEE